MPSDKLTELGIKMSKSSIKENNYMMDKDFIYSFILIVVSTGGLSTEF